MGRLEENYKHACAELAKVKKDIGKANALLEKIHARLQTLSVTVNDKVDDPGATNFVVQTMKMIELHRGKNG